MSALTRKGIKVPTPVRAAAMIDTGASGTVINPEIVKNLGIHPVGRVGINTPSTTEPVEVFQYNVDLVFPNHTVIPDILAIAAPLGGQAIQCLVGRDVLKHGVLTYIGYINQFTLSF